MKEVVLLLGLLLIVTLLFSHPVIGGVVLPTPNKTEGEIYTISVKPEIKILDNASVLIGVKNPSNEKYSYKLYVFVIKDAIVNEASDFIFSLKPGGSTTFSLTFTPSTIGEYEVMAKLYDDSETELLDAKTSQANVTSDVGPFDLSLDVLARAIAPSTTLPVILKMKNRGEKGSEVKVRVSMYCTNQTIENEFFIFLKPKIETEKTIYLTTCDEENLKVISAELILFNKTFVTSNTQVFLKKTPSLNFKIPEKIEVKVGESKVIGIVVENRENISFNNLRLTVEHIPSEWFAIKPPLIVNMKPGEEAIFMWSLSVPAGAEAREYPISIDVGGDEVFSTKEATLTVSSAKTIERVQKSKILQMIKNKRLFLVIILCLFLLVVIKGIIAFKNRNKFYKKRVSALQIIKQKFFG